MSNDSEWPAKYKGNQQNSRIVVCDLCYKYVTYWKVKTVWWKQAECRRMSDHPLLCWTQGKISSGKKVGMLLKVITMSAKKKSRCSSNYRLKPLSLNLAPVHAVLPFPCKAAQQLYIVFPVPNMLCFIWPVVAVSSPAPDWKLGL